MGSTRTTRATYKVLCLNHVVIAVNNGRQPKGNDDRKFLLASSLRVTNSTAASTVKKSVAGPGMIKSANADEKKV